MDNFNFVLFFAFSGEYFSQKQSIMIICYMEFESTFRLSLLFHPCEVWKTSTDLCKICQYKDLWNPVRLFVSYEMTLHKNLFWFIIYKAVRLDGNCVFFVKCVFPVDSKGFWRWWITLRITGFLDFVHRPGILETRKYNVSEAGSVSVLRWG
jgi:hypothetical protein